MKILIVEDDQAIAEMYQLKCELTKMTVRLADNGLVALEILKEYKPDVILLDILMPEMNGIEMLKRLRANEEYQDIPVIVLTNTSAEEVSPDLWGLGISGYIVKANTTPSEVIQRAKATVASP